MRPSSSLQSASNHSEWRRVSDFSTKCTFQSKSLTKMNFLLPWKTVFSGRWSLIRPTCFYSSSPSTSSGLWCLWDRSMAILFRHTEARLQGFGPNKRSDGEAARVNHPVNYTSQGHSLFFVLLCENGIALLGEMNWSVNVFFFMKVCIVEHLKLNE